MTDVLTPEQTAALRACFTEHDYTVSGVIAAIGEGAHAALGRNSTIPAVQALRGRHNPLATLTLLWPLQRAVPRNDLDRALPGLVEPLISAEVLQSNGDQLRALVDIRPYATDDDAIWIVSDLTPGLDTVTRPIRPDFVLGVSSASSTLAQLTPRRRVGRALDLGTGCGVQSVHLAAHADQIVATDLNPRALRLARATLDLNRTDLNRAAADLRLGSLYEPVAGERFDLIVTNPPYVLSPPRSDADRLTYREGDHLADRLVETLVRDAGRMLSPGGSAILLANWAHVRGQPWTERLTGWIDGTGCDAHVVQREVMDPYAYIELWLADAGLAGSPDYAERYAEWLAYFAAYGIEAVGMGWIVLHRPAHVQTGHSEPWLRLEDWPHPVEQPIGPAFDAEHTAVELDRSLSDAAVLAGRWRIAPDVVAETIGRPGDADPEHVVYRQQRGFRRAVRLDTATAGILGACDGDLPLGVLIETVASLLDIPADGLTKDLLPRFRQHAVDGLVGLE